MTKTNLAARMMLEVISFGGIPCTRATAYEAMTRAGCDKTARDWTVFRSVSISEQPWPLADVLALYCGHKSRTNAVAAQPSLL
jgi:hypothetical protein